jgi:hypothetical protein
VVNRYPLDGEWVKIMLNTKSSQVSIDFQCQERRAGAEDVLDVLNQVKAEFEAGRSEKTGQEEDTPPQGVDPA